MNLATMAPVTTLKESKVKRVHLIGRRGALEVAFTIKELRELARMEGCFPAIAAEDMHFSEDELVRKSF
jgi:adrenodoxin-NADP+ reductase